MYTNIHVQIYIYKYSIWACHTLDTDPSLLAHVISIIVFCFGFCLTALVFFSKAARQNPEWEAWVWELLCVKHERESEWAQHEHPARALLLMILTVDNTTEQVSGLSVSTHLKLYCSWPWLLITLLSKWAGSASTCYGLLAQRTTT